MSTKLDEIISKTFAKSVLAGLIFLNSIGAYNSFQSTALKNRGILETEKKYLKELHIGTYITTPIGRGIGYTATYIYKGLKFK